MTGSRNLIPYAHGRIDLVDGMARIISYEKFDEEKHGYSIEEHIRAGTHLDLRGSLTIHPTANFGHGVKIITASHLFDKKGLGRRFLRTVKVDKHAFVGSGAVLFNCWVQEHALVSVGSVVSNKIVPAWSIVEGNPAKIAGWFNEKHDRYVRFENGYTEEMEKF